MFGTGANARGLGPVDDHTVRMTDSPAKIELARQVVDLVDRPDAADEVGPRTLTLADGRVIASIRVRHASMSDLVRALRSEDGVDRMALFSRPQSTLIVSGSAAQVEAALAVARSLDVPTP